MLFSSLMLTDKFSFTCTFSSLLHYKFLNIVVAMCCCTLYLLLLEYEIDIMCRNETFVSSVSFLCEFNFCTWKKVTTGKYRYSTCIMQNGNVLVASPQHT